MGKTNEAIEIASSLIRVMPTNVTGHVVRARALESQGDFREALVSWRHARDLLPNSPLIQKGLRRTAEKMSLVAKHGVRRSAAGGPAPSVGSVASVDAVRSEDAVPSEGTVSSDNAVRFGGAAPLSEPVDLSDELLVEYPTDPPDDHGLSHDLTADVAAEVDRVADAGAAGSPGQVQSDDLTVSHDPVSDDLDGLIAELEDARIKPSDRAFPTPDLDSPIENVATETLARIFAEQKQFDEAARVYDRLADLRPDHRDEFLQRAVEMRERADRN